MKINTFITMSFLLFLCSACWKKLDVCKEMELSIRPIDYAGSQLKTNGYYFEESSTSTYATVYFLYRNGILYGGESYILEDAKNGTIKFDASNSLSKQTKYVWGAFQVNGNTVVMEHWRPIVSGCYKTMYLKGEIQNDSTFVITHRELREKTGQAEEGETVNITYRFRPIPQKPDSTNDFVK